MHCDFWRLLTAQTWLTQLHSPAPVQAINSIVLVSFLMKSISSAYFPSNICQIHPPHRRIIWHVMIKKSFCLIKESPQPRTYCRCNFGSLQSKLQPIDASNTCPMGSPHSPRTPQLTLWRWLAMALWNYSLLHPCGSVIMIALNKPQLSVHIYHFDANMVKKPDKLDTLTE